jgi:DNA-directed RNA polymerase subunit K/omega
MTKIKEEIEKIHKNIHKIILTTDIKNKYRLIPYIARWAAELKYKEEYKDLLDSERVNIAIHDVLTGKVTIEDIKKLPPLKERKKLSILQTITELTKTTEEKEEKKDKKTKDKK